MTDPADAAVGLKPGPAAALQDPANVLKGKIMDLSTMKLALAIYESVLSVTSSEVIILKVHCIDI